VRTPDRPASIGPNWFGANECEVSMIGPDADLCKAFFDPAAVREKVLSRIRASGTGIVNTLSAGFSAHSHHRSNASLTITNPHAGRSKET
jgi:hypothetical protein